MNTHTLNDADDARSECTTGLLKKVLYERASHAARGYGGAHDEEHGLDHLHQWAERYATLGTDEGIIKAASLVLAAADLRARQARPWLLASEVTR